MPAVRSDYAVPFHIDTTTRQVASTDYPSHVDQMIRQVLLTAPGERVDLPQFGCGLRQLVFSPLSATLAANTEINVLQALGRWLAGVINVVDVTAETSDTSTALESGTLQITITYALVDTLTMHQTTIILP
jgi:uncharacterized protein